MLHVVMSGFNPHVECLGAMTAPLSSCGVLVQQMRKDYAAEKFGVHGTQLSTMLCLWYKQPVKCPPTPRSCLICNTDRIIISADGRCHIVVDTLGPTVQANWNGIWQAVSSTIAICGRAGKGGKASVASKYCHSLIG
jgi:hypothetical protein